MGKDVTVPVMHDSIIIFVTFFVTAFVTVF